MMSLFDWLIQHFINIHIHCILEFFRHARCWLDWNLGWRSAFRRFRHLALVILRVGTRVAPKTVHVLESYVTVRKTVEFIDLLTVGFDYSVNFYGFGKCGSLS